MIKAKKKALAGLALTAALTLGSATAAFATIAYPGEGGVWDYGNNMLQAWSKYQHDVCHGSSLKREGVVVANSGKICGGQQSLAIKNHAPWTGGFSAYYKVY